MIQGIATVWRSNASGSPAGVGGAMIAFAVGDNLQVYAAPSGS